MTIPLHFPKDLDQHPGISKTTTRLGVHVSIFSELKMFSSSTSLLRLRLPPDSPCTLASPLPVGRVTIRLEVVVSHLGAVSCYSQQLPNHLLSTPSSLRNNLPLATVITPLRECKEHPFGSYTDTATSWPTPGRTLKSENASQHLPHETFP